MGYFARRAQRTHYPHCLPERQPTGGSAVKVASKFGVSRANGVGMHRQLATTEAGVRQWAALWTQSETGDSYGAGEIRLGWYCRVSVIQPTVQGSRLARRGGLTWRFACAQCARCLTARQRPWARRGSRQTYSRPLRTTFFRQYVKEGKIWTATLRGFHAHTRSSPPCPLLNLLGTVFPPGDSRLSRRYFFSCSRCSSAPHAPLRFRTVDYCTWKLVLCQMCGRHSFSRHLPPE